MTQTYQNNKHKNYTQTNNKQHKQLAPLMNVFETAMNNGFYGSVEVKLENGQITIIKKTESIKLP